MLPRAKSRPSANIGQVRIVLDSLLSRPATAGKQPLKIEFPSAKILR